LIDWNIEKVEIIAPLRYNGFRLASLCYYLMYRGIDDDEPGCFAIEIGTGLGTHARLFKSKDMNEEIIDRCGYKPTPFSDPNNIYKSKTLFDGNEVVRTVVQTFNESNPDVPYITVSTEFEKMTIGECLNHFIFPSQTQEEQLKRAMTISDSIGIVPSIDLIGKGMASDGRKLDWIEEPPERNNNLEL